MSAKNGRGGSAMSANAESIAVALGGRKTSRGWRARCPGHNDQHPSLDLEDRDGRVLFVCRAGCTQAEIIAALRERSLWSAEHRPSRPLEDPFLVSGFYGEPAPSCCLEGPPHQCKHWRQFDIDMTIARLHANLTEAAGEVVILFKTAGYELTPTELRDELNLAVELGGSTIVPWHMSAGAVEKMIGVVVTEAVNSHAARTRAA